MNSEQKEKLLKIHQGIVYARWAWIFVGAFGGEILKTLQRENLSPLAYPSKIGPVPVMLIFASAQVLLNVFLHLYLKKFGKKISGSGIKILNFFQVYADLFIFAGFFYFNGSIESPGATMFFIPLVISLIVYRQVGIVAVMVTTLTIFTALTLNQYYGHIYAYFPHFDAYKDSIYNISTNSTITIYVYYTFVMAYIGSAIFGSLVSKIIRKREEELVTERDRTDSMIEKMSDGIIMISEGDNIISINNNAKNYLGTNDIVVGRNIKNDFSKLPINVQELMKLPSTESKQKLVVKNPQKMTLEISTIRVQEEGQKKLFGSMKVLHDITREEEMDRLKTEFISVASHQLRSPLTTTQWSIRTILDGDLGPIDEKQREFMLKAYKSNEQMVGLVNDLLNVSRIEEGRFLFTFETESLEKTVSEAIESAAMLIERMKQKNIQFIYNPPKERLPLIELDSEKIQMVLINLLENAINYTTEGKIEVSLHYDPKEKINVLSVSDTGIGIPEEEKQFIFKKFFRAQNTERAKVNGSGLGLYIVKNIIEKHRGTVHFDSQEGRGTTFYVNFPMMNSQTTPGPREKFETFIETI
jgi:signal transduction histidine kinase